VQTACHSPRLGYLIRNESLIVNKLPDERQGVV
jgi:hypothetical protein